MTILFNKPYGVLSQFTGKVGEQTLSNFGLPKRVYAAGRLDKDSEGLLLLTDDGKLKHALIEPRFNHSRTYLIQLEGTPTHDAMKRLANGVLLDGLLTKPAQARILEDSPIIADRIPSIRFRKTVPTSWVELELTEGRNRQVRKMTAAVGYPTLRLVRTRILFLTLEGLEPGHWRPISDKELLRLRRTIGL